MERPPQLPQLIPILALIAGLFLAIIIGTSIGGENYRFVMAGFGGVAFLFFLLAAGWRIWIIIPATAAMAGSVAILPLPFSVAQLGVLTAFGMYTVLTCLRKLPRTSANSIVDYFYLLNLVWIATVFFRNPAGVRALGSELVGGRAYFDIIIGGFAYYTLRHAWFGGKLARYYPFIPLSGALIHATFNGLTAFFPSLAPILYPFYTGIDISSFMTQEVLQSENGITRAGGVSTLGLAMATALFAYNRPIGLLIPTKPVRSALFLASVAAILLGGYRSHLIYFGLIFVICCYFHGGLAETIKAGFGAVAAMILLFSLQQTHIVELPISMQRTLSFLPGDWNQLAVADAKASSEWRLDMWKIVWNERSKWLPHPILGSGFGYSPSDLAVMEQEARTGVESMDGFIIRGSFHSGPLSSVRYGGVIGFLIIYGFLIAAAVFSVRLIKKAKGTPFFPATLFVGAPYVYSPITFVFVFGAYDSALAVAGMTAGLLNILNYSLDRWLAVNRPKQAKVVPIEAEALPSRPMAPERLQVD